MNLAAEGTYDIYKKLYCVAGEDKFKTCKRYIVSEITGKPTPMFVLPNSTYTVKQILNKMLENGDITEDDINWVKYEELVGNE